MSKARTSDASPGYPDKNLSGGEASLCEHPDPFVLDGRSMWCEDCGAYYGMGEWRCPKPRTPTQDPCRELSEQMQASGEYDEANSPDFVTAGAEALKARGYERVTTARPAVASPARLDTDGTAKPKTEIRGVFHRVPNDDRVRTLHDGMVDEYIVRPTLEPAGSPPKLSDLLAMAARHARDATEAESPHAMFAEIGEALLFIEEAQAALNQRSPEAPRDVHLRDVCIALIRCWDISPDTAGDGLEASFYDNLAELRALVMPDTARTTSAPPIDAHYQRLLSWAEQASARHPEYGPCDASASGSCSACADVFRAEGEAKGRAEEREACAKIVGHEADKWAALSQPGDPLRRKIDDAERVRLLRDLAERICERGKRPEHPRLKDGGKP